MYKILIPILVLIILVVVIIILNKKISDKVLFTSKKIASLLELNRKFKFHYLKDNFLIDKHYDNKSNFYKVEPAYLMSNYIRSNLAFYSDYINKIKENREKNIKYSEEVRKISSTYYNTNYKQFKIPKNIYDKYEIKLFLKHIIKPVINCSFLVNMTYTSPKGRVVVGKSGTFTFNDICTNFESVSRTRLDKKTYNQLITAERGEISDSLRYDIFNRDNFTCVLCGASARQGVKLHVDHIIPVSKGGKSVPSNLRTLCERCNIGKSNKIENIVEPKLEERKDENDLICERCGSKLVLRKSAYGEFYGCSNYPKCKFIKKI